MAGQDEASAGAHNEVSGGADGVVQARDVQGGIHVHQAKTTTWPVPRQLASDIAHFTGRDAELARLDTLLESADGPVTTMVISAIAGAGGMGKTSLAVRWAHRARDRFPDGELCVNLRGFDPGEPVTPEEALDRFLRALDVPGERIPHDLDERADLYRSLVAGRRMLVLLDNAANVQQVRPLLPGSPTCLVIVTSRSQLAGLLVREGTQRISLDVLSPGEAMSLLRQVIGAARAEKEREKVAELARRCAYLPLALRIAAERVAARPHLALADLVEELADDSLEALAATDDETTQVRTVFSWSYRALSAEVAKVFRFLGLHPGPGVSLPAAVALAGGTTATIRRQLNVLTGVHLLSEISPDRYQFHDLLRDYAAERATAEEPEVERARAVRQLFSWYLHTAHAAQRVLYPQHAELPLGAPPEGVRPLQFADRDEALAWYDAEYGNLWATIGHAADAGLHDIAWQLPHAIGAYLRLRYRLADRITAHRIGLAAANLLQKPEAELWALLGLGEAHSKLRQFDDAIPCFLRALTIAREIGHRWGEGAALGDLGAAYLRLERFPDAVSNLEQALAIHQEIYDPRNEGLTLTQLASAFRGQLQFERAVEHAQHGLAVHRKVDNAWDEAYSLRFLGLVFLDLQRFAEAIDHLQQALMIFRKIGHPHRAAESLTTLGEAHNQVGRYSEARESWREALAIFDDLGSTHAAEVRTRLGALDAGTI